MLSCARISNPNSQKLHHLHILHKVSISLMDMSIKGGGGGQGPPYNHGEATPLSLLYFSSTFKILIFSFLGFFLGCSLEPLQIIQLTINERKHNFTVTKGVEPYSKCPFSIRHLSNPF